MTASRNPRPRNKSRLSQSDGSFASKNRALLAAPPPVFARTYKDLVRAIDAARAHKGWRHEDMDARIGWPCGYSSKIVCGMRPFTARTLFEAFQLLELKITVVPDTKD